jgi:hypothetical protein
MHGGTGKSTKHTEEIKMSEEIIQEEINRIYDRDENGKPVKNQLD